MYKATLQLLIQMDNPIDNYQRIANSEIDYLNKRNTTSVWLYMVVLIAILVVLVSLPFIVVDITIRSPIVIESAIPKEEIFCPISGFINNLNFRDNLTIKKGDELFRINESSLQNQILLSKTRSEKLTSYLADINKLLKINQDSTPRLKTTKYQVEYDNLQIQLLDAHNKVEYSNKQFKRFKRLWENKAITQNKWEEQLLKFNEVHSNYTILLKKFQSQWQAEAAQIQTELYSDQQQIYQNKEISSKSIVKANTNGTIYKLLNVQEGSFIQSGAKLAEIVPNDSLIAICYLNTSDIGFVRVGQHIQLQISAYNYSEWGSLSATVLEISNDVVLLGDKTAVFKVKAKIQGQYLRLKNGYKGFIRKGMTGNAGFYLTKRSLWQLLYDNINNWLNPNVLNK